MSGAEPAYAPYLRFARNVLIVDMVMGAVVLALSWWQGWTSVEESTTAIFGGGAVLLAIAILPNVGPWLPIVFYSPFGSRAMSDYAQYRVLDGREDLSVMHPSATLTLLAAGAIPVVYAAVVATVFL